LARRGVILDRDGTLIDFHRDVELGAVVSAFHPDQIRWLPGVLEGLRALADAGFTLAIATNQPGAAKGQIPWSAIERTNAALVARLASEGIAVEEVAVCGHHPEGGPGGDAMLVGPCDCRKPAPGLLVALARSLDLDVARSWMIGDTAADVGAAHRAGMRAGLLLDERRCELCPGKVAVEAGASGSAPDLIAPRFDRLAAAIVAAPTNR
jgi:D-glycero-D-manno-heptose 1,7-bisphosphate phosphatase